MLAESSRSFDHAPEEPFWQKVSHCQVHKPRRKNDVRGSLDICIVHVFLMNPQRRDENELTADGVARKFDLSRRYWH